MPGTAPCVSLSRKKSQGIPAVGAKEEVGEVHRIVALIATIIALEATVVTVATRLKERNDPRGVAINLPFTMPDDAFALAKAAVDLKDPYAIREVGTYFLGRIDLGRNPVYDPGGLQASPRMMHDAFTLAACAYGGDCGQGSARHVKVR